MGQYNDYLVGGEALERVLQEIHGDQQRQDSAHEDLADSMPTSLDVIEISELWNNN